MIAAGFARPEVQRLRPYELDLSPCRFKLDQNEVPWELPRRVKEEMARRLVTKEWARYPDFHAERLRARLAARHDWSADGVLVGNGSNELLQATLLAVAAPASEVLGLAPSFGLYGRFVLASGARMRALGPRADLALPLDELDLEIERNPRRTVLLASPNNPTGEAIAPERIERWLERLDAPLLLDNAYGEFCRYDYRPLLKRFPNLILFRTFSKAWSLAGLRLGYLLADPGLVAEIVKMKLPYNLGHAAAIAGELALDEAALVERRVALLRTRRAQWFEMLANRFAEALPSEGNFVLVRDEKRKAPTLGRLAKRSIRVRDVSGAPGLAGCLRFSVGGGAALRAVAAALSRSFSGSLSSEEPG